MRTIKVSKQSTEVNELLDKAREEDLIVRSADGHEFMVVAIDEFDAEAASTKRNEKLMALLDERAAQTKTVPLVDVKQKLGLGD